MKKRIFFILGWMMALALPAIAQPDTITKPDRTKTYQDPKITDDKSRSKVLLDTSHKVADSLLNHQKQGRKKQSQPKSDPMGTSDRPVKLKKAPVDSGQTKGF